jgi:hypothetical protein
VCTILTLKDSIEILYKDTQVVGCIFFLLE